MTPIASQHGRFTTRRMFLWTFVVAVYMAVFTALPATSLSLAGATAVLVLFLFCDFWRSKEKRFAGVLSVSYFACGLAYTAAIAFLLIEVFPAATPPQPPLSFWSVITGAFLVDFLTELGAALSLFFAYLEVFVLSTLVSTFLALPFVRRQRSARWLLLMNAPGILLLTYSIGANFFDEVFSG